MDKKGLHYHYLFVAGNSLQVTTFFLFCSRQIKWKLDPLLVKDLKDPIECKNSFVQVQYQELAAVISTKMAIKLHSPRTIRSALFAIPWAQIPSIPFYALDKETALLLLSE